MISWTAHINRRLTAMHDGKLSHTHFTWLFAFGSFALFSYHENAFALIQFFVIFHCTNFDRHFNWLFQFCMFICHFVCFVWLKSRIVVAFVMLFFFSFSLSLLSFVRSIHSTHTRFCVSISWEIGSSLPYGNSSSMKSSNTLNLLKHNSLTVCPFSISLSDSLRYSFTLRFSGWQFIRCLCDFTHTKF